MPAAAACSTASMWSTKRAITEGPLWQCRSTAPRIRASTDASFVPALLSLMAASFRRCGDDASR
jgi:hypothetical protein